MRSSTTTIVPARARMSGAGARSASPFFAERLDSQCRPGGAFGPPLPGRGAELHRERAIVVCPGGAAIVVRQDGRELPRRGSGERNEGQEGKRESRNLNNGRPGRRTCVPLAWSRPGRRAGRYGVRRAQEHEVSRTRGGGHEGRVRIRSAIHGRGTVECRVPHASLPGPRSRPAVLRHPAAATVAERPPAGHGLPADRHHVALVGAQARRPRGHDVRPGQPRDARTT